MFITSGGGPPSVTAPDPQRCSGAGVSVPDQALLGPDDVWPGVIGSAQAMNVVGFPSRGCAAGRPNVPAYDCSLDFPWFGAEQAPSSLAYLGVTEMAVDTLTYGAGRVTEYLLELGGFAGGDLTYMASQCDGDRTATDLGAHVYRGTASSGGTSSLLRIDGDVAVALVFSGVPEEAKDDLFAIATARAGQA